MVLIGGWRTDILWSDDAKRRPYKGGLILVMWRLWIGLMSSVEKSNA